MVLYARIGRTGLVEIEGTPESSRLFLSVYRCDIRITSLRWWTDFETVLVAEVQISGVSPSLGVPESEFGSELVDQIAGNIGGRWVVWILLVRRSLENESLESIDAQ
jgi:hypothetical protein